MREILGDLDRWIAAGSQVVVARVVDIDGSGPRLPGAAMAVDEHGEVIGSVSGGCVEGAVVTEALAVLADGHPRLVSFGYSDDDAFAVGLTCGGTVHLFLAPLAPWLDAARPIRDGLAQALADHRPVATATVVEGPGVGSTMLVRPGAPPIGTVGDPDLDRVVARDALGQLAAGTTEVRHYGSHGEAREAAVSVFIESFAPPPRLLIFGAVDFTAALARAAKLLGYRVTVCDAREVFATRRRFPMADDVVVEWPNRFLEQLHADPEIPELGPADAVCVLTHDHKFDVPAVLAALVTDVGYIGAMGSRRTHADREARLREHGITDEQLARLHSPIGLDLGARTPEEVAVAVLAEIIAVRTGRAVPSLRDGAGPLH
jgi:xanthine dehydrogenase accessory factor